MWIFFKACDVGFYGINCEETCGRCLRAENCSFTDGTCFGGCQDGYRGRTCQGKVYYSEPTQGCKFNYSWEFVSFTI